jgi:hypothetical protein
MVAGAAADGYLTTASSYDGYMYVFGKGKSKTTVEAPLTAVPKGQGILIQGSITDQSPAQPDSPCISKESMATYMEYLHMQKPIPSGYKVTGVPIQLLAIDANGHVIDIGTMTSDVGGTFKSAWTPPDEGLYTITANFVGDDSYGSSWAETGLSVGPAPAASPTVTTTPISFDAINNTVMTTVIGGVIAIIIAIAIVGLLMLRKRP